MVDYVVIVNFTAHVEGYREWLMAEHKILEIQSYTSISDMLMSKDHNSENNFHVIETHFIVR